MCNPGVSSNAYSTLAEGPRANSTLTRWSERSSIDLGTDRGPQTRRGSGEAAARQRRGTSGYDFHAYALA